MKLTFFEALKYLLSNGCSENVEKSSFQLKDLDLQSRNSVFLNYIHFGPLKINRLSLVTTRGGKWAVLCALGPRFLILFTVTPHVFSRDFSAKMTPIVYD